MRNTLFLLAALVAASLLTAAPALAGDVDPTGAKLRSAVEDYLAKAPENDAKAPILEQALNAPSGAASNDVWTDTLCNAEILTIVGAVIWDCRRAADACRVQAMALIPGEYCRSYSRHCDHWRWDSDCMSKQQGCHFD